MIAGIALFFAVCLYRLLPVFLGYTTQQPDWLINFSPMAALCLCGAACLPRRWAIALPFAALLGTDIVLNWHYGHDIFTVEFWGKTLAFAAIAAFGWQFRGQPRAGFLVPAAIGSSLFFYIVTNTASWLYEPAYSASIGGWAQALTTGLPAFQPTWMFHRNTFISDVVFTLLFLACVRQRAPHPAAEKAPAAAW